MADLKTICFDIDGVLCSQVENDYAEAKPHQDMIDLVNRLHGQGYRIILHTSRFMGRCNGDVAEVIRVGQDFTKDQLAGWGVRYHELHMGKPRYTWLVDDRSVFYERDAEKIAAFLAARSG